MAFRVQVEEYAELILKGSHAMAVKNQTMPIYTWASKSHKEAADPLDCTNSVDADLRGANVSCPQIYAGPTHIASMVSLVINMRDGLISSFAWDNGCQGCAYDECMYSSMYYNLRDRAESIDHFKQGACGTSYGACAAGTSCDLKVFVTWAGTDREQRHLASAGMRLSKFTGYTLGSLYRKAGARYAQVSGEKL